MFFQRFPKTQYDFYESGKTTTIPDLFRNVSSADKRFVAATTYQDYFVNEERPDQLSFKLYGTPDFHWSFFIVNDKLKGGINDWPLTYNDLNDYIDDKFLNNVIRLYREVDDDINYNSISGYWSVGQVLTGATSGATATVTKRDEKNNQLTFTYNTSTSFSSTETINGSTTEVITDKYDIRLGKNAVHHFEDADNNLVSNFENYRLPTGFVTNSDYEKDLNDKKSSIRVIRSKYIEEFAIIYRRLINE
tara:strand:- start:449 stop:1192 length:744 start_codon:yes stop_codon:yes gene_type:complete